MVWMVPPFADQPIPVTLIGVGGTGSMLATRLAKIAVALKRLDARHPGLEVTLVDDDVVSPSNIGRQVFYLPDVGKKKATVLAHRVNCCEGLDWRAVTQRITTTADLRSRRSQIVLTAVDSRAARQLVHRAFQSAGDMLWLDCGNNAHTGQVVLGARSGYRTVLPSAADLFPEIADPALDAKDEAPSCSLEEALLKQDLMINPTVANTAASLLWQVLRHGQLDCQGAFLDVKAFSSMPMPIDANYWRAMGWDAKTGKRIPDPAATPPKAAAKRTRVREVVPA